MNNAANKKIINQNIKKKQPKRTGWSINVIEIARDIEKLMEKPI